MSVNQFHFKNYRNTDHIGNIKARFGFRDDETIEKFIMDFEMLYHVKQHINCTTRGGMSVPFHIPDTNARRLSVDIDLVTDLSETDVESSMMKVRKDLEGLVTIDPKHKPTNPMKELPLLTYYVKYPSCFGDTREVKIDMFYNFDRNIPTKNFLSGYELFAFKTDYNITAFDHGSVIGDKVTTLGFNTIGIDPGERGDDIPKHIYDIATLLKIADEYLIRQAINVYGEISDYENSIMKNRFNKQQIIEDVLASLNSLHTLDNSGFMLTKSHEGRYRKFKLLLLGKHTQYTTLAHLNDILLIQLFTAYTMKTITNQMNVSEVADKFYSDLQIYNGLSGLSGSQKRSLHGRIVQSHNSDPNLTNLKHSHLEQLFLYDKIKEIENY